MSRPHKPTCHDPYGGKVRRLVKLLYTSAARELSNRHLADIAGVDETTVRRWRKKLYLPKSQKNLCEASMCGEHVVQSYTAEVNDTPNIDATQLTEYIAEMASDLGPVQSPTPAELDAAYAEFGESYFATHGTQSPASE